LVKSESDRLLGSEQASESAAGAPESQPPFERGAGGGDESREGHQEEENGADRERQESTEREAPPQPYRARFKSVLFDVLETLLLTIVLYAALSTFIGRYKVLSVSMEPTLYEGEYLLISKQTHKIWPLERGNVVVFHYPRDFKKNYIKRIIGLPGEKIELRDGKLYVNSEFTPEPWVVDQTQGTFGQWSLGEDEYFVMGDNRNNSSDSRAWGPVKSQYIIGKALFCYWPVTCWGPVEHGFEPTPLVPFDSILSSPLPAGSTP
jgi:signal peptidase I